MKRIFGLLLLAISLNFSNLNSKEVPFNFGLYGGLGFNFHSTSFHLPTKINTDTLFFNDNATGITFNGGVIANFPLNETFTLSGRLGIFGLGGTKLYSTNDSSIAPTLNYLEISPILEIHNLIPVDNLFLLGGLEIGIPISSSYDFINLNSDIDANTRFALAFGAGMRFILDKNTFLTPEATLRIPLNNVSAESDLSPWKVPQLRIGVALTFSLDKFNNDKSTSTEKFDIGMKEINALDMQGKSKKLDKISLEEYQYTELFPIVPYVFFEEGIAIPNSKNQSLSGEKISGAFKAEELEPDAILINKYTLDIVGSRMKGDINASIKLIGTNDGMTENKNTDLSLARANYAKDYLVNTYQIPESKISVESTNLPTKASSIKVKEGIEENRRVEIVPVSSNSKILEPLIIQKDRERLASPAVIEFVPYIMIPDSIKEWNMELTQSDRLLRKISGYDIPENIHWSILPNELAANDLPVEYNFSVELKNGEKKDYNGTIPVEYFSVTRKKSEENADKSISKFSLILFDFDSPEVSENDKKIVEKYIIPAMKFNSTVQIYGFTDNIGDEKYNQKLALQRANNVKSIIQSKVKDAKFEVYGIGEEIKIYDNGLPTGRQLSRTVQIVITTPKN